MQSPRTCCAVHKNHDKRESGLFKEKFRCTEMLCLCSNTYCCYDSKSDNFKFSSKILNKRPLEDTGDVPMSKYRRVLVEAVHLRSTNRGFKTCNHLVGTYEQTKKILSYFYPKIVSLTYKLSQNFYDAMIYMLFNFLTVI